MINIRPATDSDRDAIWEIFQDVIAAGDTFPFHRDTTREQAFAYWFGNRARAYIAEKARHLLGSYMLRSNWSGPAGHVANAAFMVAKDARGQGIGREMGEHCLKEARRLGFRAMQFNFVVSTNESAVKLWQDLGMKIVGTLPAAFRHPEKGYVDVYVMFQSFENA